MRIVIDLQAAQSTGSRNRGIGRYSMSLALAMVRHKGEHEIIIALNGLFQETIEPIRAAFEGLIPQKNICVWYSSAPVNLSSENTWRRQAAELIYEAFLISLRPDIVHISSLFEGGDDTVTSIKALKKNIKVAVTLYDLIPYIYREIYLTNDIASKWYDEKIGFLRNADILLGISESARQESIRYLGFPEEMTINISTAADEHFKVQDIDVLTEKSIRNRYGIVRPFVMYTGGVDHRKNIEGLIRAYAMLPKSVRLEHQLAVVCSINAHTRELLENFAYNFGLERDELIMTGFISEDDLLVLYNLCKLFVFPSWHEGFGLPALEAMCCGRATIGANTSSIPEVIGREDALFDPRDDTAIKDKILHVLTNDLFRTELEKYGLERSKLFSWDGCANRAISAFEKLHADNQNKTISNLECLFKRPRMAYISPLPPERSGISDYSAELLPELSRHYQIDVIVTQDIVSDPSIKANNPIRTVEWFKEHSSQYDRILYHFGNSHFHQHMFKLFYDIPGVVVLHDFFLGGILSHMESLNYASEIWLNELYAENGYFVSKKRFLGEELLALIHNYPCGYRIHKNAIGIIYHSQYSLDLSNLWYENSDISNRKVIPLLRKPTLLIDRLAVRNELKFKNDDFLVCSFGLIGPNKMSDRIIKNWIASFFATQKNCYLIFVGENQDSEYGQSLIDMITNSPCAQRIHITGWVDTETYQKYLSIANIGIQLRTHSRGETSAAVLDCMNYGISTIVNSNGSMAYLSNDGVFKLSDEFTDIELRLAIETLYKNLDLRNSLGERAREIIVEKHAPRFCADKYAIFIEDFYNDSKSNMNQLINRISYLENSPSDKNEWLALSESIANTFPSVNNGKQLIIDISSIVFGECSIDYSMFLLTMIEKIPKSYRIEPVYFSSDNVYRYARKYTFTLLSCLTHSMKDDVVEYVYGDLFFSIAPTHNSIEAQKIIYDQFKAKSIPVYTMLLVYDDMYHIELATHGDGTICISTDIKILLENYLSVKYQKRIRPYKIELLDYTSIEKIEDRVEKIIDIVTNLHWSYMWIPDGITRFFGSDCLFGTQIGLYNKTCIDSTNTAGYLLFGPYISMPAGNYRVSIKGNATVISSARMDVAVNGGGLILGESLLSEADINGYVVSLFITLERPCSDLEIRVWVDKESVISIALIEIIPEESEKYNQDHVLLITETNVEEEAQELKESNEVFIVKNEISEEDVN